MRFQWASIAPQLVNFALSVSARNIRSKFEVVTSKKSVSEEAAMTSISAAVLSSSWTNSPSKLTATAVASGASAAGGSGGGDDAVSQSIPILIPRVQRGRRHTPPEDIGGSLTTREMSLSSPSSHFVRSSVTLLNQRDAAQIDVELMNVFSTDQLMELAGLSVAQAICDAYFDDDMGGDSSAAAGETSANTRPSWPDHVVVVCGPGNNGGDGLVAARHLRRFWPSAVSITVVYPKLKSCTHPLYSRLLQQLRLDADIAIVDEFPTAEWLVSTSESSRLLIVDAIFGYSFRSSTNSSEGIREPFRSIIDTIRRCIDATRNGNGTAPVGVENDTAGIPRVSERRIVLAAVDIPSGWDVNTTAEVTGGSGSAGPRMPVPDILVSLMLPKLGVRSLLVEADTVTVPDTSSSHTSPRATLLLPLHYLGGRFVPSTVVSSYGLQLPSFPVGGGAQFMRLA